MELLRGIIGKIEQWPESRSLGCDADTASNTLSMFGSYRIIRKLETINGLKDRYKNINVF